MEVIEKLEDVLSGDEVSPLGPILIAKVCPISYFTLIAVVVVENVLMFILFMTGVGQL